MPLLLPLRHLLANGLRHTTMKNTTIFTTQNSSSWTVLPSTRTPMQATTARCGADIGEKKPRKVPEKQST